LSSDDIALDADSDSDEEEEDGDVEEGVSDSEIVTAFSCVVDGEPVLDPVGDVIYGDDGCKNVLIVYTGGTTSLFVKDGERWVTRSTASAICDPIIARYHFEGEWPEGFRLLFYFDSVN